MEQFDIVVVGSGIWGDSARQCFQDAGKSVCLIYDHNDAEVHAASNDVARIIRAEYSDPTYRKAAKAALELFRTQAPYSKYYHEPGWFLIQDATDKRYESIPGSGDKVTIETVMSQFPKADINERSIITTTSGVGWVEANRLQMDLKDNARPFYSIHGKVTGILFREEICYGVRVGDKEFRGSQVILATGWRTNELLQSAGLPTLQYQIVGAVILGIELNQAQYNKYKDNKIICDPGQGEIIPPTTDRILRVNNPNTFLFDRLTTASPKVDSFHKCFDGPKAFLQKYCPDLMKCPIVIARICMDTLTDGQTFFIERNHGLKNLHCIGGGSFHSWKFRPVLPGFLASKLGLREQDNNWDALLHRQTPKHAGVVPSRSWE